MENRKTKRERIKSNPPRYRHAFSSKNRERNAEKEKTIFFMVTGLDGEKTKIPVNLAPSESSHEPENPEISKKLSLGEYIKDYDPKQHWMPRFIPHSLMHWWEGHFYQILRMSRFLPDDYFIKLTAEGFIDLLVILSAKPESVRINKFILNYVGRRVNEYLDHMVVDKKIPYKYEDGFLKFFIFIFCFLTTLLEISKKLGHEENTQMLEKLVQRALKKVELKLRDVIDNYTEANTSAMLDTMSWVKCSFFAKVIPNFERQTEGEIQKLHRGYNPEDIKVVLKFWKEIGTLEIEESINDKFNIFVNKLLLDKWLEEERKREEMVKTEEVNANINPQALAPADIAKLRLIATQGKISFDQILDRDFGIWARESSDQRRISFLTYKYLDKN